jgi:hypothetical protein
VPNIWRFPIIGSVGGPGGFFWFIVVCFGCRKSLNKKYEKVKRRKANIVVAAKDMSTMNGLVWIK